MLEDKDIIKLTSLLATKKDLEGMATKKDLEEMALNSLKIFATKQDLDEMVAKNLKVFATKQDVAEVKSDVADLKELMQSLIVSTDKIVKSLEILSTEYRAVSIQLTRHEKWIKQLSEKAGIHLSYE